MKTHAIVLTVIFGVYLAAESLFAQAGKPAPRPTMTITVTNLEGKTLPGVSVTASGPVEREAVTDESGLVTFRNMSTGTYRLRFEHDDFVTLERDVTQTAKPLPVNVSLTAAPSEPPPTPEKPETPPPPELPPPGPPTTVSIPDFFEENRIGNQPSVVSLVGCTPSATTNVVQLRDPLPEHVHTDVDEVIYVVAGDGTHSVGGRQTPITAGVLAVIPRGTPHSIVRRGGRPIVLLSILSGQPCVPKSER